MESEMETWHGHRGHTRTREWRQSKGRTAVRWPGGDMMLECHGGRPGEALEQNKVDTRQKRIHVEIEDRLH